jgi:hydroxyacylglutathione hydrolase
MFRIVFWFTTLALAALPSQAADLSASPAVRQMRVGAANVYLVKTNPPLLIDSGGKADLDALQAALKAEGVSLAQIKTIILTHGHADHAGLAAELRRRSGALLVAGAAETPITRAGHNDELKPTSFMARILKQFALDPVYEGFDADLKVDAPIDLQRFGLAGQVLQMPGHTPGSLVVVLDDGRAFVGDMVLGGWLGGALLADRAGEHYFHADLARNHANIAELLQRPIHTFYLGHGGPVSRASVVQAFGFTGPLAR